MGLAVVSIFAGKGLYRLYQYSKNKHDEVQTYADIAKDGMDGVKDLVDIFSNNEQEKALCDNMVKFGKCTVGIVAESERWQ